MSVYSINQRVTDQSAAASATKQQPQANTAEMAFAQALQTSLRFSPLTGALPGAATALQAHFDRADAAAQQAQPAAQPQAKAPPAPQRGSASSVGSKAGKAQQSDGSSAASDSNNAPQSAASAPDQSAAPAKPDRPDRPASTADDGKSQNQGQAQDTTAQGDAQQVPDAQAMAAAVLAVAPQQVQQQAAAPVQTQQASDTGTKASDANAAHDPFAWLQNDHGAMISKLQKQITADAAADPATPAFGPSLTAATAAKGAAKGMTMVNQAAPTGADQQAQDMAAMLNGTGANLAIHATTTGPQSGAQNGTASTPAVDLAAIQAAASADGSQANAQADTSGKQGFAPDSGSQGTVASQPQAASSAAPSPAAQAADSATFAAALAAQAADAPAANQQAQGPQTPQGATPLAAVGATQAADSSAPTQAARAPTPPRTPQQEVMDQVSVEINKQAKDGADTIKIALKPGNLGRIEVKLDVKHDGTVSATVTADNKDTLAMLQKDASGLTQALSDAGLKTDPSALSFNLRGDLQQQQQQQAGTGGQGRSGRGRRQFSGVDAVGDAAPSAGALRGGFGRSGVDIQV